MISTESSHERCGYTFAPETEISSILFEDIEDWHQKKRSVCCWREATHNGRCVLHSDSDKKPLKPIQEAFSDPDQRVEGCVINNVETIKQVSFEDSNLVGIDFSGLNLAGLEIKANRIRHCDFSHANLSSTTFTVQSIFQTKFNECNLSNAIFNVESDITSVEFRNADLRNSSFEIDYISSSDFTEVDFRNTDLSEMGLSRNTFKRTIFTNANLSFVNLNHTNVREAIFRDITGECIDLWKADLKGANFQDANVSGGNFGHNDFTDSVLKGANFTEARLEKVDLSGKKLEEVRLSGADLSGANLSEARLDRSDLTKCDLQRSNLASAEMHRASLNDARLEYANLSGSDLRNADFSNARFYQALLTDARINDMTMFDNPSVYEQDLVEPYDTPADSHDAAIWVYRSLSTLYEQNAMGKQAQHYHIRKEEAKRKAHWENWNNLDEINKPQGFITEWNLPQALIYEVNRWTSLHGESPYRVLSLSGFAILFSALLYPLAGIKPSSGNAILWTHTIETSSGVIPTATNLLSVLAESVYFSTVTFTTLGYGDVRPLGWAKALATVESLLGTLLMALLVFVLGRQTTW